MTYYLECCTGILYESDKEKCYHIAFFSHKLRVKIINYNNMYFTDFYFIVYSKLINIYQLVWYLISLLYFGKQKDVCCAMYHSEMQYKGNHCFKKKKKKNCGEKWR